MTILLAFAPFFMFAVVERLVGATAGLLCGAIASLVLIARDALSPNRKVKVLEVGTALLFGGTGRLQHVDRHDLAGGRRAPARRRGPIAGRAGFHGDWTSSYLAVRLRTGGARVLEQP